MLPLSGHLMILSSSDPTCLKHKSYMQTQVYSFIAQAQTHSSELSHVSQVREGTMHARIRSHILYHAHIPSEVRLSNLPHPILFSLYSTTRFFPFGIQTQSRASRYVHCGCSFCPGHATNRTASFFFTSFFFSHFLFHLPRLPFVHSLVRSVWGRSGWVAHALRPWSRP